MPHFPAGRYDTLPRQRLSAFFVELSFDYAAGALPADHQLSFLFPAAVALYDRIITGFPAPSLYAILYEIVK